MAAITPQHWPEPQQATGPPPVMTDPFANDLPPARLLLASPPPQWHDVVVLTHRERLLHRRSLTTVQGRTFRVDLPAPVRLDGWWGFELEDGRAIQIIAADESLWEVTGDLAQLAWQLGSRHAPCQIEPDRILTPRDPRIAEALTAIATTLREVSAPFHPAVQRLGDVHAERPTPRHDAPTGDPF